MLKFTKIARKIIIYAILLMVAFSAMIIFAPKAQAAEKKPSVPSNSKTSVAQQTIKKVPTPVEPKISQVEVSQAKIQIKSKIDENKIFLAWNPLKGAKSYLIEWGVLGGQTIQMKVVTKTSFSFENLQAGTSYVIQISGIDAQKRLGKLHQFTFKTLGVAPVNSTQAPIAKALTPKIGSGVSTSNVSEKQVQGEVNNPQESPKANHEQESKGWSKILVALAILIIAAGVAVGGYYGYEWWAARSEEDDDSQSPKPSNRW